MTVRTRQPFIDIRSNDRVGLLHSIADAFYKLDIDVRIAKISSEGFTVMDSFYVAESSERKVSKANRIEEIKNTFYVTEADGGKVTDPSVPRRLKKR